MNFLPQTHRPFYHRGPFRYLFNIHQIRHKKKSIARSNEYSYIQPTLFAVLLEDILKFFQDVIMAHTSEQQRRKYEL